MRLGIIGLPQSGKSTVFEALTKNISDSTRKIEDRIGTVRVPDSRIDALSAVYHPQKTIYAQVEYFLPGSTGAKKESTAVKQLIRKAKAESCKKLFYFGPHRVKNEFKNMYIHQFSPFRIQ